MSIFVNIAAYRDFELPATLDSVVNNSTNDLHISIVEQCTKRERIDPTKWESDRVKISLEWMHPLEAKGAGYARHLALEKYAGEDYYLQIDSHTELIQKWDEKMIAALNLARDIEQSDKVILSSYPAGYSLYRKTRTIQVGHKRYKDYPQKIRSTVSKTGQLAAKRVDKDTDLPELCTTLLAGYIFGPGEFTVLGYNPHIPFWGEEFYLAINAWMEGWKIYAPHEMYIWHHYARRDNTKVWDDLPHWTELEENSYLYLEEYFKSLDRSLLHDDHNDTIDKWLAYRAGTRESNIINEIDIDHASIVMMLNNTQV